MTKPGTKGCDLVANTDAQTGAWSWIQVIEDAVFSLLTDATMTVAGTLSGITFPAGTWIAGTFTAFTLTSGTVIAYKSEE